MKLEDQAAEDRFMMSDSLKDVVNDKPVVSKKRAVTITIQTPSQDYVVIGRVNGIKHVVDTTELNIQLSQSDPVGLINDPPQATAKLTLDAAPFYSYEGDAEIISSEVVFTDEAQQLKISFRRLEAQSK